MRHLFRSVSLVLATAALLVAGSSSALAAADPTSTSIDASFCYQSGADQYCYDTDGTIRYLDTAAGSSVQVNKLTKSTHYRNGELVGDAISASFSRSMFEADGTVVIQTVTHTRSDLNGEPCTYRLVARLVDYESVLYKTEMTCG